MKKIPNKWAGAFDSYIEDKDPKAHNIETFQQLITNVGNWLQYGASEEQIKATAKISERELGIKPYRQEKIKYPSRRYREVREARTYKQKTYLVMVTRDLKTGRYAKKGSAVTRTSTRWRDLSSGRFVKALY